MFISDTDSDKKTNSRITIVYLAVTAFCGFFSSIYGKFSHGVSSDYMVFLCLIPFCAGVLPYLALKLFGLKAPVPLTRHLYNCGVATLCVGSCLKGVFEIYGSRCIYVTYYFYVGAAMALIGVVAYVFDAIGSLHTPSADV